MTQDTATREKGGRNLSKEIFVKPNVTAHSDFTALVAAIGALDDTMDTLLSALPQDRTIKQTLLDGLPEPFKANSTNLEKAHALICWATNEVS